MTSSNNNEDDNNNNNNTPSFSTSLCDLFADPLHDHTSFCALTCCGTFLQDRNEYILNRAIPLDWWIRLLLYVGVSLLLYSFIGASTGRGLEAVVIFLLLLGVRATLKRASFRRQVLRQVVNHNTTVDEDEEADCCTEGYCSPHRRVHRSCSLVRADPSYGCCGCATTSSSSISSSSQQPDACTRLWQCLAASCCGCCGCWWNCCGVCATAQEGRELKRHLPAHHFYIDYISFESWSDYYPQIQALRRDSVKAFWRHVKTLSQLSQTLLKILFGTLLLLMMASALHLVYNFSIQKVLVIIATLLQAVLVLWLCHWHWYRLDLSLDAVVKLFASGFLFATIFSMVVEQVLTILGNNVLGLVLGLLDAHQAGTDRFVDPNDYVDTPNLFFTALIEQYPVVYILHLAFSAYIVAGTVEETAKYFSFWMVEHPDFVYENESDAIDTENTATASNGEATTTETQPLIIASSSVAAVPSATTTTTSSQYGATTLLAAAPTIPPLVFEPGTFRSRAAAITVAMIATASGFACLENLIYVFGTTLGAGTSTLKGEITILLFRSALPVHPLCAAIQSIGVVYRDIEIPYNNNVDNTQQSSSSYGLGRAMLPAIILHGTFDFVLFVLGFVATLYGGSEIDDNDTGGNVTTTENGTTASWALFVAASSWTTRSSSLQQVVGNGTSIDGDDDNVMFGESSTSSVLWLNILSLCAGPVIFLLGVVYYAVESYKQRQRLNVMDRAARESATTGLLSS